jgi:ABC-2 type transport system permease protein
MWIICKKELKQFFSSLAGFLAVGVFLLIMGLLLFVLPNSGSIDFNLFQYGFASLDKYFSLAPWILIILVPAICMRLLSDEYKQGTFETLVTKPLAIKKIVIGKWLGGFLVALVALLPTIVYAFAIKALAFNNKIDSGAMLGSYFGLILLAGAFAAVSLFASSLTNNYIISFLLGVIINLVLYSFFNLISKASMFVGKADIYIQNIGMDYHYQNLSRGMIFFKDVLYFIVVIALFIWLSIIQVNKKLGFNEVKRLALYIIAGIVGFISISILVQNIRYGLDVTNEKRFTMNAATKSFLKKNTTPIEIKMLLNGTMPAELKRLKQSADFFLQNCRAISKADFSIDYIDITKADEDTLVNQYLNYATAYGLKVTKVAISSEDDDAQQFVSIVPGAIVVSGDRAVVVNLFKNALDNTNEQYANDIFEGIIKAESLLEYNFGQAFYKATLPSKNIIGISGGNGETLDLQAANFSVIAGNYFKERAIVNLDSINGIPESVSSLVINNPTKPLTDKAKLNIDQYLLNGGNVVISMNALFATMDSLFGNKEQSMLAYPINTGFDDLLFNYGIRVNPDIIQAKVCDSLPIKVGEVDGQSQFKLFGWSYSPILQGNKSHPITQNLGTGILTEFGSSIDTISSPKNKKTILLSTLGASAKNGSPTMISVNEGNINVSLQKLKQQNIPLAVLAEGNFSSLYKLRLTKALSDSILKWTGKPLVTESVKPGKLIVISDGEVFRNEVYPGQTENDPPLPTEMGFNIITRTQYDNPEFFDNCLLYVNNLNDGLAIKATKNKNFKATYLNPLTLKEEVKFGSAFSFSKKGWWQFFGVVLPIIILLIAAYLFNFLRKRKYTAALIN